jgi:hypothetical protein
MRLDKPVSTEVIPDINNQVLLLQNCHILFNGTAGYIFPYNFSKLKSFLTCAKGLADKVYIKKNCFSLKTKTEKN